MELLSILDPPITDLLNDPRVTSEGLLKIVNEQHSIITKQMKELAAQVKKEDLTALDLMMFALLQHHLHVTVLNTKLTARTVDFNYSLVLLSRRLERLTKWLIWLTIVLGILAIPLAVDVVLKWLK